MDPWLADWNNNETVPTSVILLSLGLLQGSTLRTFQLPLQFIISSLAQTRWQKEHYFKWIVYVEQTQFQIMQVDTSISWNSCGGEAYSKFTLTRIDVSRTSIRILVFLELTWWGWSIWEKYLTTNRKCNMKSEYN